MQKNCIFLNSCSRKNSKHIHKKSVSVSIYILAVRQHWDLTQPVKASFSQSEESYNKLFWCQSCWSWHWCQCDYEVFQEPFVGFYPYLHDIIDPEDDTLKHYGWHYCLYIQLIWPSSQGNVNISNNLLFCIQKVLFVLFEYIDKPMVLTEKAPPKICSGHHFQI